MKKSCEYIIKGIYAGLLISIGGIVFLAISNKVVGAFLFSIGLLTICMYNFNLYTGKIGYIIFNKINYLGELFLTLIGNFLGTFLGGNLIRLTRYQNYIKASKDIINIKLNDNLLSIFILSCLCGVLMYLAVNNFKNAKDNFGKYICIFMSVMTFILCGFEHCVANMFYFSIANIWNLKVFLYLLIMILGNSIGSIILALYTKYYKS